MKINWKSLGAGAVAILGVLAPNVGSLPHNVGVVVTLCAILAAAFGKPAVSSTPAAQ